MTVDVRTKKGEKKETFKKAYSYCYFYLNQLTFLLSLVLIPREELAA